MGTEQAPPAPGWDAIDAALRPLYGARPPRHYGTLIPYRLGGPDPLHGISAYFNATPVPHWHFVSYGLTELWEKESDQPEVSGFGFELTFRLAVDREEPEPPMWALGLLQNLARYVFTTGNYFAAGHHFDLGEAIAPAATRLTAVAFREDPQLGQARGPHGVFQFLQVVGLHHDELDVLRAWNTLGLLELMAKRDPLLVTRLDRPSVLEDAALAQEVRARSEAEGSATGALFAPVAAWSKSPWGEGYDVTLDTIAVENVQRLLHGRIRFGRPFTVSSGDAGAQRLWFEPSDEDGLEVREGVLHVRLTAAVAEKLRAALQPKKGDYLLPELPGLAIQVVPGGR